ncbi:MAG: hypothetical protein ABIJ42_04620 [Acidobacteriota bacterium]
MKIISRFLFFFSFLSFSFGTQFPEPGSSGNVFAARSVSGVMSAAFQRSRVIPAAPSESGYVVVNVVGADDIIEVLLSGGQVTFRTVRGQKPQSVTADFSSSIPAVPDLILSITKLNGRGNVGLAGSPDSGNNYTVTLRVIDSARGRDNCTFRLDWRLPGTAPAAAAPAAATRASRNPLITRREVPSRTTGSRTVDKGYVELKIDGVDDIVEVEISGNNAQYLTVRGINPQQVSAEFSSPVPRDATLSLGITKSYGRGNITLTERPTAANNYTTIVRLMDSRGGKANYKFRLNWEKTGSVRSRVPAASGTSVSSIPAKPGHVVVVVEGADDILDIRIRGEQVETSTIKGATPRQVESEFSAPLPLVPLSGLVLTKIYGRGNVVLMEGPDQANDFTATVRIMDSERSQDIYRFRLTWEVSDTVSSDYTSYENVYDNILGQGGYQRISAYAGSSFKYTKEGSFAFRAIVDETALIKIESGELWGMTLKGQPVQILDARFSQGYPQGDMERLDIYFSRGRGEVEILEKPWSGNNYAIVIRIHDSRGGDDEYAFELRWKQK